MDASWLLLAALISWTLAESVFPGIAPDLSSGTYWWMAGTATIGLLFSIVFHELAHSIVARQYGIAIRGITLFIFGGIADMEGEPGTAKSELLMAAAGPAASFLLAAILFALFTYAGVWAAPSAVQGTLWYLALINGMLALFNLIPAFPLDGGRMLRAALWMWRGDFLWATRIAAGAGNLFGILLIVLGLFEVMSGDFVGGMWRFLIGLFLKGAADASLRETMTKSVLQGVPVSRIMNPQPISVPSDLPVAALIDDFVYRHHHRTFPVTKDGHLVGSVGTEQAASLDRAAWAATAIDSIMSPCAEADLVAPETDAVTALAGMKRSGRSRLWVVDRGRLVGILSLRDMLEFLSVKLELESGTHPPRQALRLR
ncbi:MAG TPA: site-2 protease family protein [Aliidongia sp.]|nr:site-2 protease family protein [Aliidongia sp.]